MNLKSIFKNESGSILLEAFIAIMVIGISFAFLLDLGALSVKVSTSIQKSTQANFLLREGMEITRSFRDGTTWATNGLGSVSIGSANPYYFLLDTSVNPNKWSLTSGTETVGIFTRKVIFEKVSRDPATSNIQGTYNPSYDDQNTRKVTVTVSWPEKTMDLITYFTNWK